ncbi:MAG: glucuronate isomerase [Bacteroidota bacterium]
MNFKGENFLLETKYAVDLYHRFAKDMPVIDYHNHLSPQQIADDKQFENLTQAWLDGDHYKWRAMRTFGIDEYFITGDASDKDKFSKWAEVVPYTVRNPLYHWTHLELQRYFDIDELLSEKTEKEIYRITREQLRSEEYSVKGLLNKMNVETVCTTDDPLDNLDYHQRSSSNLKSVNLLPTFRPDKAYAVENGSQYQKYIDSLDNVTKSSITSYQDLISALYKRADYFHESGCRLSDHGLERLEYFEFGAQDVEAIFRKVLNGLELSITEVSYFKFITLVQLCKKYHELGWVQQFHLGALRNVNTRMLDKLGVDTGFDSVGDFIQAKSLGEFLNILDSTDQLAKTILYNLNPTQNEVFASMIGNFNDGSVKGKIQFGSGWWFNDQLDGMERQMNALSNMGLLSCFVGMLTDSRSFLSFPRHEYFRRLLCNMLGNDIKKGLLPNDMEHIGQIVQDISYNNAKAYFKF